jgi:hypothetical protein
MTEELVLHESNAASLEFKLPMVPIPPMYQSPVTMVIFSKPKVGKTTAFADLPGFLILDLQQGTKYLAALKVNASSVAEIGKVGRAIEQASIAGKRPYRGVVIDTATDLQQLAMPYAEDLYAKSPQGKNWFSVDENGAYNGGKAKYGSITNMPDGNGYPWLYLAFEKLLDYIKTWAPLIIISGHVKDTMLDKNGALVNAMELDLTGRLKRMLTSDVDAVGYMYRKGNQNILSFKTTDEVGCGARPDHLKNREIVISEYDAETDKITTFWEEIYID